ncbi:unnamed protein product [Blumeria hordei]|uniref:Uncharacterized protein n=1 Tax=Blumeria hordei TaxID=2867405 RepID=A0A383UX68_BLUHO|nr:unnamed protein product [Blumeria hordei]
MRCTLALLLLNDLEQKYNDRLITMPLNGDYKFYRIYDPRGMREFRDGTGSDIIMAASQIRGPGTHMAVYCSPSQNSRYLRKYIAESATELNDISEVGFHQPVAEETMCLRHIQEKFRKSQATEVIPIMQVWDAELCSRTAIYSLAFQNRFCIQNAARNNLTPCEDTRRKIGVEYLFLMSEVVLGHKLYLQTDKYDQQTALVWYQGYLNIFQRSKSASIWKPKIRSIQDTEDFDYIIDFIAESFNELASIKSALRQGGNTIIPTPANAQGSAEVHHVNKELYITQQLQRLSQKDLRLTEYPAHGLIGPFVK